MNNYLKISFGIILILSASRFVPHPPNFTSLIALSFYVPVFLGIKFLPPLILGFILTDLIIGIHNIAKDAISIGAKVLWLQLDFNFCFFINNRVNL